MINNTIIIIMSLLIRFRRHIQFLAYKVRHLRNKHYRLQLKQQYKYDAFVIFAEEDLHWVWDYMLPKLETDNKYRLCIHLRDFLAGPTIADNITESMMESRKIIALLTNSFLRRKWCRFEFEMAFGRAVTESRDSLIVVLLGNLKQKLLTYEVQNFLNTNTYLELEKHNQAGFWQRLRNSLEK